MSTLGSIIPGSRRFTIALAFVLALFSALVFTHPASAQKIGTANTVIADPPVPHPNTTPCTVVLFSDYRFANFNAQNFAYAPPTSCTGPWAKVILEATFSITRGIQYDRTANIWIGPTNIYFGTTAEDDPTNARVWHVQRDLTDYSTIFTTSQTGTVDLGNLVNSTYTGVIHGTATLYFYPPAAGQTAPVVADQVIGFSSGPNGGTVGLGSTTSLLEQTLTLPTNIQGLYFDVFSQSQSNDEFWYSCSPNDIAPEIDNCGNTAFRESEITIDGTPAGVAPVYPWVFTGGIDPYLWIPLPGVQTMNFRPYRVNLSPFAGMLDDGNPHTIALSVFNADNYFSATAALLLYLDHGSSVVTGGVTQNTLTPPSPAITENVTYPQGNFLAKVNTTAGHNFQISGYVNTSAGTVTTTVAQDINFTNDQKIEASNTTFIQDVTQDTTINSTTTVVNSQGTFVDKDDYSWPFTFAFNEYIDGSGNGSLVSTIDQSYIENEEATLNSAVVSFKVLSDTVTPTDTLVVGGGYITGNENQSSQQSYFALDLTGYCYSKTITAAANAVTGVTNGAGCAPKKK